LPLKLVGQHFRSLCMRCEELNNSAQIEAAADGRPLTYTRRIRVVTARRGERESLETKGGDRESLETNEGERESLETNEGERESLEAKDGDRE